MSISVTNTTGRRKRSVARVYIQPGKGEILINGRDINDYLHHDVLKMKVNRPFDVTGLSAKDFDLSINVQGGGVNGQAEAIRLAIARALEEQNPELRPALKKDGLLTVDSRQVERKKYGRRKARKRFQFSKR